MSEIIDIVELIKTAKIGGERKAAQTETCTVFAAALHDHLAAQGIETTLAVAWRKGDRLSRDWYHLVVRYQEKYFDSLGVFDAETLRTRLKVHHSADFELEFQAETREGSFEDEYTELYFFLVDAFKRASRRVDRRESRVDTQFPLRTAVP